MGAAAAADTDGGRRAALQHQPGALVGTLALERASSSHGAQLNSSVRRSLSPQGDHATSLLANGPPAPVLGAPPSPTSSWPSNRPLEQAGSRPSTVSRLGPPGYLDRTLTKPPTTDDFLRRRVCPQTGARLVSCRVSICVFSLVLFSCRYADLGSHQHISTPAHQLTHVIIWGRRRAGQNRPMPSRSSRRARRR